MNVSKLIKQDWLLTVAIIILLTIGTLTIYSATYTANTAVEGQGSVNRQLIFIMIGFIIYFAVASIDFSWLKYTPIQIILYTIIILLLLYLLFFGEAVRNTNRWIEIGFVNIQPSEYAKVILIIINAGIISRFYSDENVSSGKHTLQHSLPSFFEPLQKLIERVQERFHGFIPFLYIFASNALIIFLVLRQPALGNALIIFILSILIFFVATPIKLKIVSFIVTAALCANLLGGFISLPDSGIGQYQISIKSVEINIFVAVITIILIFTIIRITHIHILVILLAIFIGFTGEIAGTYTWDHVIKDYQKARVETFLHPEKDPQGNGYQVRNSKIAIGSGRVFGKGFLQGTQSKLKYLPEAHNDFIFATFAEEFGFVGSLCLIGIYIFIFIRIALIGYESTNIFGFYIAISVGIMIAVHVFINIGMNMGIMPVTGIPLPLVSYGGSSVMVIMISLGLVQSVFIHKEAIDRSHNLVITSQSPWRA